MKIKVLLMAALTLPTLVFGNMGPQGFHQFKKRIFVETGTFGGSGIQKALDAGFLVIYSIDIEPVFVNHCKKLFKHNPNVHILLKDSSYELWDVICGIHE